MTNSDTELKTTEELLAEISLENETWIEMKDMWPNYYVSSKGRVYSSKRNALMQQVLNSSGYPRVHLINPSTKQDKQVLVHRLVALHFIPNPATKPCIDHINGDRTDARLENLRWCTYAENIQWMFENKKRRQKEEAAARQALLEDIVENITNTEISLKSTKDVMIQLLDMHNKDKEIA